MATNNTTSNQIDIIYNGYKTDISELIANIEVYEHDLPKEVMVQISEIFRAIASYEHSDSSEKEDEWNFVQTTYSTVLNHLYVHAIFLFNKKIYDYDKLFRQYNYKGVMIEKDNFITLSNKAKQELHCSFTKELKKCYKHKVLQNITSNGIIDNIKYLKGYVKVNILSIFMKHKKEPFIPINDYRNVNFISIYKDTKKLLYMYQKICPSVIQNGTKKTLQMQCFSAIFSWIVPLILCINVILTWNGKSLISYILEFFIIK